MNQDERITALTAKVAQLTAELDSQHSSLADALDVPRGEAWEELIAHVQSISLVADQHVKDVSYLGKKLAAAEAALAAERETAGRLRAALEMYADKDNWSSTAHISQAGGGDDGYEFDAELDQANLFYQPAGDTYLEDDGWILAAAALAAVPGDGAAGSARPAA